MERANYLKLKDFVSDLKKFREPGFFPVWLEYKKGLFAEISKARQLVDAILQICQPGANPSKEELFRMEIAERNCRLRKEAEKVFKLGAGLLEEISTEGLWIRDEVLESTIKAENEFRIAESIRARKARSIPVVTGEDPSERRPFFPRRRECESLSGGDLSHKDKMGPRIFEPYKAPDSRK